MAWTTLNFNIWAVLPLSDWLITPLDPIITPTPTPTPTSTHTSTPTPTPTPTHTHTLTPTPTHSPTPTITHTHHPSPTPSHTIPVASNYPTSLDSDTDLFIVHDALRMTLAEDYYPGNTSVSVVGDSSIMNAFPPTGIITLTEQCSEIGFRALSFYYGSKSLSSFNDLEILPEFSAKDNVKPKGVTHVTLNVVAQHHNALKDALIAVEEFMGVRGKIDTVPFGDTLTGRLNFLMKLVFTPKAWFRILGSTIGLVPLDVYFSEECFRLGTGEVLFTWNFGENSLSTISAIQTISITDPTISIISVAAGVNILNVYDFIESSETYVKKTYLKTYSDPGKYDVELTVLNAYGSDTVMFQEEVNPRIEAPKEATIAITNTSPQYFIREGYPIGGPYTITPILRCPINTIILLEVDSGVISGSNPPQSYAGELLDPSTDIPYDPVTEYIWSLGDELTHSQSSITKAMYSIGGIYDIKLRTNTEFGAFRITDYVDALDIVENNNLWLWTEASSVDKRANEFGLISETFKLLPTTYTMLQNDSFLTGSNNEIQAKREFKRNATVAPKDLTVSGQLGHARMYWSQGSNVPSEYQYVGVADYQGFFDTYTQPIALNSIRRYWNWLCLSSTTKSYFLFGSMPSGYIASGTNPSDQSKGILPKTSLTYDDSYTFSYDDYINGADELMEHVSSYDSGQALNGYFAVYRGCWKGGAGYFVRNDGVDPFFRLKSFYKTESVTGNELSSIKKLPEMSGTTKVEGQLVPLTNGVFFFNNTGSISAYNDTTGTWETGGPSLSSIAFKSVQDTTVVGFDNPANTLLAASDGDYLAYLSFDYSTSAFIKFNGQNLTFSSAGSRPAGEQFTMAIY